MNKTRVFCFALLALLLISPVRAVKADEMSELKQQMSQMMERLAQLEARQKLKERQLAQEIADVKAQKVEPAVLPASLKWLEKIKISGDFRYRHEHIDSDTLTSRNVGRDRHRIRARLMLTSVINDEWGVGFRIATGDTSSATSTNQDLDDGFVSKDLWLDLAYFDFHPASISGLNMYGGKIKNPFLRVGSNQVVWDSDVTLEGIAATYQKPLGETNTLNLAAGGFWVDEEAANVDTSMWGVQAYIKHDIGNPDYILGGVSYWDYMNINGQDLGTAARGNTFVTGTNNYAYDYNILELFAEYGTKVSGLPVAIFGSWVDNLGCSSSDDTAWVLGFKLNKAKDPGSWQFSYNYRNIEADAVLGALNDGDFTGGGTDGRGHTLNFGYQVAKNTLAALTFFQNEGISASKNVDDYQKLHADLVFKF